MLRLMCIAYESNGIIFLYGGNLVAGFTDEEKAKDLAFYTTEEVFVATPEWALSVLYCVILEKGF